MDNYTDLTHSNTEIDLRGHGFEYHGIIICPQRSPICNATANIFDPPIYWVVITTRAYSIMCAYVNCTHTNTVILRSCVCNVDEHLHTVMQNVSGVGARA